MEKLKYLLSIEYAKFKDSAILRLLIMLYVFIFPFTIFLGKRMLPEIPDSVPFTLDILYEFPSVWDYQGYVGSWLIFIFLGFVPIHIICSEVSYKTMRQSIINGMTRRDYFLSKVMSLVVISLIATVYYFLVCSLIGWFNTPNPSFTKLFNNDFAGTRFFISCMGYMSIALLLAVWMKRSGLALFSYLAYIIAIEPAIRWGIYWKLAKTKATLFFPANMLEDVMPLPLYRFADFAPSDLEIDILTEYTTAAPVTVVYILLMIGGAYYLLTSRDI
jgi:ABC-type transport system involved in multi-copper enzyme maturation permease subunit